MKISKLFIIKQEKHSAIKLLARSKLNSIADIISQPMQDGDISSIDFIRCLLFAIKRLIYSSIYLLELYLPLVHKIINV